jgi:hypothetical protein
MKPLYCVLLLSVAATVHAQVVEKGLILDLDADKGVEVEDGDRVVKWTNEVAAFAAEDFLKRDQGRREPGLGRPRTPGLSAHGQGVREADHTVPRPTASCNSGD